MFTGNTTLKINRDPGTKLTATEKKMEGGRRKEKTIKHQTHRRTCISETNTENLQTLIDAICYFVTCRTLFIITENMLE